MTIVLLDACIWQKTVSSIPCLCWGILALSFFIILFKYIITPIIKYRQEQCILKEKHEQEKFWYFQNELKKDYKKELEDKIKKLESEIKELSDKLKKEKEEREKKLKEERLKAEHDFYEKVVKYFYSNDKEKTE